MDNFREVLLASQTEKKGVQVYVAGQSIGMLVTGVSNEYVQGRSQQFGTIVVRIDKIDAVAKA